jgi:ribosomal protein S18 acetylase RimI-like enzyme
MAETSLAAPPVLIREASPADLEAVVELIRQADGRNHQFDAAARALQGLNPEATRAWLAFVGERPVGLTMVWLRTVHWGGRPRRAAYWMHLYTHPDYRNLMLYPRLTRTMVAGAQECGCELLYTIVRRRNVVEAHLKIGFRRVDELPVLAKLLRPFRFAAKYWHLPRLAGPLAGLADGLYRLGAAGRGRRPPADVAVEAIAWPSPRLEQLAALWHLPGDGRLRQDWTAPSLRQRYEANVDGEPYTLLGVRRGGRWVAAVIYREAVRERAIRIGVVMDLIHAAGDLAAARHALAGAERRLRDAGCEAMLYLDGLGGEVGQLMAASGYRETSERYVLIRWPRPKEKELPDVPPGDRAGWRLAFGDHDAF